MQGIKIKLKGVHQYMLMKMTTWSIVSLTDFDKFCVFTSWCIFIHGAASLHVQNEILLLSASVTLERVNAAKCCLSGFCTGLCMHTAFSREVLKMLALVLGIWVQTFIIAVLKLFHKTVLSLVWPGLQNRLVIPFLCNSLCWIKADILFESMHICWIIL